MAQQYRVDKRTKLLPYLFEILDEWAKKKVKQRLQSGAIFVNGLAQTKYDFIVCENDVISIGMTQRTGYHTNKEPKKLEIIYNNNGLIAINKPAGLLSVGTNKDNKNHALALLRSQLSRSKESIKLWPVHRLDRDTSGILLFATSKELRELVMKEWARTEKTYLAVVEGTPKKESDTITQPLRLDEKEYRMHVGKHKDAKSAITKYNLLKSSNNRSLLEVNIETGRQHQIRAHLSWIGNAIVGDERYGKKGGRMGLHSRSLKFNHPITKKDVSIEVDAPSDFYGLLD